MPDTGGVVVIEADRLNDEAAVLEILKRLARWREALSCGLVDAEELSLELLRRELLFDGVIEDGTLLLVGEMGSMVEKYEGGS